MLTQRDWFLLPLVSLLTVCLLSAGAELIRRTWFGERSMGREPCLVLDDPATGPHGVPHSSCWNKIAEGDLVEYRYNSCGYRSSIECRAKQPGVFRIVLIGSSIAMGLPVAVEQSFASLLPQELTRRAGRKVELYNLSLPRRSPHFFADHFSEVRAADPDMILWILTRGDIQESLEGPAHAAKDATGSALSNGLKARIPQGARLWVRAVITMLRHFLYASRTQYVSHYLMDPDAARFLAANPGSETEENLRDLERDARKIAGGALSLGVPWVAALIPDGPHAVMISTGDWPANVDPYRMGRGVKSLVLRHGGRYIDTLPKLRDIPSPEDGYFRVYAHPNAHGQMIYSGILADGLMDAGTLTVEGAPAPEAATSGRDK